MTTQNIIILVAVIIIGIILIRFIAKLFLKLVIFLIVAGVICYLLFFLNGGLLNSGKKQFILYELQAKYCTKKFDSVKCECIIMPLITDIKRIYTPEQISEFSKDPLKTAQVLIKILNDNKTNIKACLKSKNADYAWEDFVRDLKSLKLGDKFKDIYNAVKVE